MEIGSFGSGSKQNCFYLTHEDEFWVIDLGIPYRRLKRYLEHFRLDVAALSGVWITHDHDDHVRGIKQLASQTQVPIYVHPETGRYLHLGHRSTLIEPYKTYHFSYFSFFPFPLQHDAVFHLGYLIKTPAGILLYASDVGQIDNHLLYYARRAQIIAIEANYDEEMLRNSWYPPHLKARIRGGKGHLSNLQSRDFLSRVISSHTEKVILLHLSENNNTKELVQETIIYPLQKRFPHVQFFISDRDEWMIYR
ncbi:MBL fold metallo-hydrolase [Thermospira aquatica]|uniref:MBL fold metallo-hydrolase n=1 Tax=Thermospira aquatica TaxID=2828656 RepID=A0AAX3BDC4_9SPIR|nr:MBL fold metallo-hydrolase [Thermospira aquatica]URA10044.1 MBL fold metallo-hydrolase [Thermospira aquatica]